MDEVEGKGGIEEMEGKKEKGGWKNMGYLSRVVDGAGDLLCMPPQSSQYLLRVFVENNGSLVRPTCEEMGGVEWTPTHIPSDAAHTHAHTHAHHQTRTYTPLRYTLTYQ